MDVKNTALRAVLVTRERAPPIKPFGVDMKVLLPTEATGVPSQVSPFDSGHLDQSQDRRDGPRADIDERGHRHRSDWAQIDRRTHHRTHRDAATTS
jgi:hypothetical protein